jgi:hypothetical protein
MFMSNEVDRRSENKKHLPFWVGLIPLLSLVGVTYGAVRWFTSDDTDTDPRAILPTATPDGNLSERSVASNQSPVNGANPVDSDTVYLNGVPGEYHPYTGIFYPYKTSPAGYEEYTCFTVPPNGTAFGTMLLGGPNNFRLDDIDRGVFSINGLLIDVPLYTASAEWLNLQIVQPHNDYGCSIAK